MTGMEKYVTVLIVIDLIAIVMLDEADRRAKIAVNLLLMLPVFGRIFGWW